MAIVEHNTRSHALLSASGSHRWLNCTPSARLEEEYGVNETSDFAKEGTLAHEIAELYILRDLDRITEDTFNSKLEEFMNNDFFNEEMLDYVPKYSDYCVAQYENNLSEIGSSAQIVVEQKLDLREYIADGFGTVDCVEISDGTMEIIDFKYGKGVPVYADYNSQLMIYALGALRIYDMLYNIKAIKLTIIQPRIGNISSYVLSVEDLINWADTELRPKAELAYSGLGDLSSGDWCRFCSVKNRCKELAKEQLKMAQYEFKKPELLSDNEISDILTKAPRLVEWANSVSEYALSKAINDNVDWPGFKVVEGISRRKWANEESVPSLVFSRCPELSEEDIYDMKLKSISQLEKLLGKERFKETLSDAVIKPQGKPTLVPESDKRPAMGLRQAQADFKN